LHPQPKPGGGSSRAPPQPRSTRGGGAQPRGGGARPREGGAQAARGLIEGGEAWLARRRGKNSVFGVILKVKSEALILNFSPQNPKFLNLKWVEGKNDYPTTSSLFMSYFVN